jgi:CRISP-associated protein Cas1
MAQSTVKCLQCGTQYVPENVYKSLFCSDICRFLYAEREDASRKKSVPIQAPQKVARKAREEETEDIGVAWQRAGIKYEEMTNKALQREQNNGKRSIIVSGNGAILAVKNGSLILRHGINFAPQEVLGEQLDKAVHNVRRIVWCAASGNLSYSALNWCFEQGIDVIVLNRDGVVQFETCPNKSADIRIKRAQYNITPEREAEIARYLILGKVKGQYETYRSMSGIQDRRTDDAFTLALSWLSADTQPEWLTNLGTIRIYEANVAGVYFLSLRDIPVRFAKADREKIPNHWTKFGERSSPLGSRSLGEKAVRPSHAILNYAYGILEHAARAALLAVGLDISVGILHADKQGRDSLIYDLMEIERGTVDAMVLRFIKNIEFRKGDFTQVISGEVRLHPELARAVVACCSISPDVLLQSATTLKNMILDGRKGNGKVPNGLDK